MANRYWVGGNGTWDGTNTAPWSSTSGGSGGASVPTSSDNVFFDANSGSVTVNTAARGYGVSSVACSNLDFTGFSGTINIAPTLQIYNGLKLSSTMTLGSIDSGLGGSYYYDFYYNNNIEFKNTTANAAIVFSGKTVTNQGWMFSGTGSWLLQDNVSFTNSASWFLNGSVYANSGISITFDGTFSHLFASQAGLVFRLADTASYGKFYASNSNIIFKNRAYADIRNYYSGNSYFYANTSNIVFSELGGGTKILQQDDQTFYDVYFNDVLYIPDSSNPAQIDYFYTYTPGSGIKTFNNLSINNTLTANSTSLATICTKLPKIVANNFTCNGTDHIRRICLQGSSSTTPITANTVSLQYVSFYGVTGNGAAAPFTGTSLEDVGLNANITFSASQTRTASVSGNWTDTATWGGSLMPLAQDNVTINSDVRVTSNRPNVLSTLTSDYSTRSYVNVSSVCSQLNLSSNSSLGGDVFFKDDMSIHSGSDLSSASLIKLNLKNTIDIVNFNSNGVYLSSLSVTTFYAGASLNFNLANNLYCGSLSLYGNTTLTFNANGYSVNALTFTAEKASVYMGSSLWDVRGTGNVWFVADTTTVYKNTANIIISNNSTTARNFYGGGKSYNTLTIGGNTATSNISIYDNNSFTRVDSTKTVAHTIRFQSGSTTTIGSWGVNGAIGSTVDIRSTGASQHKLVYNGSGKVVSKYLDIGSSNATPLSTWFAVSSSNSGNNYGWVFGPGSNPLFFGSNF